MRRLFVRAVALVCAFFAAACSGDEAPGSARDAGDSGVRDATARTPSDGSAPDACLRCVDSASDSSDGAARRPDRLDAATTRDAGDDAMDVSVRPSDDAAHDARTDAERPPDGYPAGPYGTSLGDTFPFHRWEGYVVATSGDAGLASGAPFGPFSSTDVARSGARFALLHVADFSCPGCNHAATVLAAGAAGAERDGALVVEILGSVDFTFPSDRAHLDAWVTTYDLHFTSVIDAKGHELETLNDVGVRETALVLDIPSMKVVYRMTGDLAGVGPASLDGAFAYIHDHQ